MNKIRISQGHSRPIVKKDFNDKYDRNLRISGNDINNQQQNINYLKKNLEGKARESNTKSNRQGFGKYNGNNIYNYGNNNINNNMNNNVSRGIFGIKEGKDYKRNDTGRNKKGGKIMGREEFSSDKIGKNIQNNKINNNDNIYNGLRSENSSKYNNSNKKRMINDNKKNIVGNSNLKKSNNISNRDKEKERKQNLEEAKRKFKREKKNNRINQDGVEWMSGMENYREKKVDKSIYSGNNNNIESTNISDIQTNQTNINDTNESNRNRYEDLSSKSNKKEINGKNLLLLADISNINLNNYPNDCMNDEEINDNNKLYEDVMKEDNNNFNYIENENNNGKNNNYKDLLNSNLSENLNYENNLEINDNKVVEDIWNDIIKDFGKEITQNISKIIKKYINDDMISYDSSKINDNIVKDLKYKNISKSLIEKAINKVPDIYYLILCNKF